MQGVSTFAILVLFMCAQQWVSCQELLQSCNLVQDGVQDGAGPDDQNIIPMDQGSDLRIFIPGAQNVVGSSLLFCDDQLEDVEIQLAEDKQSYLVNRLTNSTNDSLYWLKLVLGDAPPAQRSRRLQSRRMRRY